MENRDQGKPQTDISKSQSAQQTPERAGQQQQQPSGQTGTSATGQADYGNAGGEQADGGQSGTSQSQAGKAGYGETGGSQTERNNPGDIQIDDDEEMETGQAGLQSDSGGAPGGFVGSQSQDDNSEQLIERDAE